jgi:hypothetical protein
LIYDIAQLQFIEFDVIKIFPPTYDEG